ncbi:MAG: flagellin [Agathobacter sp.]|nr:flagellin [Agathobacter sp.]
MNCEVIVWGKDQNMKINLNMSAVTANNQLRRTENRLQASMERLSSGLKINRPGDNPAGMAISNRMKEQIDALDQAENNANDGVSVLQIADGALNEVSSILQRIRELSVQAASDTYCYEDKYSIQEEIDQLKDEVNRVSTDTEYNNKVLLDGSSDTRVYSEVYKGNKTPALLYTEDITRILTSDTVDAGEYDFTVDATATKAVNGFDISSITNITNDSDTLSGIGITGKECITINDAYFEFDGNTTKAEFMESLRETAEKANVDMYNNAGEITIASKSYGSSASLEIKMTSGIGNIASNGFELKESGTGLTTKAILDQKGNPVKSSYKQDAVTGEYSMTTSGMNAKITILTSNSTSGTGDLNCSDSLFSQNATYSADGNRVVIKDNNGFSIDFYINSEQVTTNAPIDISLDVTDIGTMTMQIGANQYQTMDVRIPEVSSESLYIDQVSVLTSDEASKSITICDDAIEKLSSIRSRIGAYQNRLDYAVDSLSETQENLTAAYSRLLDTDMAEEMVTYANQNILNQAGISVLTQANDLPQQVLSLLQ